MIEYETVTPDMAEAILARSDDVGFANRRVQPSRVRSYAEQMERGEWGRTHQGIAITSEGALIDGQHRLHAIVESRVSVTLPVERDADPQNFRLIDTQGGRRMAQFAGVHGDKKEALARMSLQLASAAYRPRYGFFYGTTNPNKNRDLPPHRLIDFAEAHPKMLDYAERYARFPKRIPKGQFTAVTPLAVLLAGAVSGDPDAWFSDVVSLAEGDGLPLGNPLRALWGSKPKTSGEPNS